MQRSIAAALALALAFGCATTRSKAGPFVTDLRFAGNSLVVSRCDVVHVDEDHTGSTIALAILLLPLVVLVPGSAGLAAGGGGGEHVHSFTTEGCTTVAHPIVSTGGAS